MKTKEKLLNLNHTKDEASDPYTRTMAEITAEILIDIRDTLVKTNTTSMPINIIFDGPPGHESGRFVEVETDDGKSISLGKWVKRSDGFWALRIVSLPNA